MRDEVGNLFSALGFAMWMTDEARLGALGAVAGAGPAYVARFIAALAKAGEKRGLGAEIAAIIARETVLGTGWMATGGEGMDSIARRVASPNGTTEAGLAVLDAMTLDELVDVTIDAAARRGSRARHRGAVRSACRVHAPALGALTWLHPNRARSTIGTDGSGSTARWSRGATRGSMS